MKITVLNPNVTVSILGVPPVETFHLTALQVSRWNHLDLQLGGVTFNETHNESQGLPCAAARRWLQSLRSSLYGIERHPLTWSDVKRAVQS